MKKSLVIISFAFIFLLSVSVVSANFFDWITGDVQRTTTKGNIETSISKSGDNTNLFSRTSSQTSSARKSQALRSSNRKFFKDRSSTSRGFEEVLAAAGGTCVKKTGSSNGLKDENDVPLTNCDTTCGPVTCTKYENHPQGWCCVCTEHGQTCHTVCSGDVSVVVDAA